MMTFLLQPSRAVFLAGVVLVVPLWQGSVFAQVTSVSSSLSDPITQSTRTSGLNGAFDAETANFNNPNLRTDVSDPTHAQLLGSSLSPANVPGVNAFVNGTPETGSLSDAQLAVRYGEGISGGRRGSPFASGATHSAFGGATTPQSSPASFSTAVMGVTAFRGSAVTRAAFASRLFSATSVSPSSNEDVTPADSGIQSVPPFHGAREEGFLGGATATDPVLTGASSGFESDFQLQGDMPTPSSETARAFAVNTRSLPQYQYDDGQTPPLRTPPTSGTVLGVPPEYGPASNGFPDSTRGLAGLPPEVANSTSPLDRKPSQELSFFSSPDTGVDSGLSQRLNPNLHATPMSVSSVSFQAYERQMRARRLRAGLSITQSSMLYQQDLKDYQRRKSGRTSRPRPGQGTNGVDSGLQQQFLSSSVTH